MVLDPGNYKQRYINWKKKGSPIEGVSNANREFILEFLGDMERGYNVTRPGPRSYVRLNNLKQRMCWICKQMEQRYGKENVTNLTKKEISDFFNVVMRGGEVLTRSGKAYTSVRDYANVFKSFWHWYMKREDEKEIIIRDRTTYVDMSPVKESGFVYFTVDEFKRMADRAKFKYKVLMWFMFDTGIRPPKELMNMKVSDLSKLDNSENYELHIRDEVAKTFGRRIKLLLCSQLLQEFINSEELKYDDYIFQINPVVANRYIRRLATRVFGNKKTRGGGLFKNIRMYDFRHSSACYWLPRYKSESALKYRFGWKENKMIHHYTKMLGMKDTIEEKDILLDSEARTKLEKELDRERKQREMLEDKYTALERSTDSRLKQMEKMFREKIMGEAIVEMKKSA